MEKEGWNQKVNREPGPAAPEQYPKAYLYQRIVKAKLMMEQRFTEPLDGAKLCDEAHFSRTHFIRLFKQVYGVSPRVYLGNLRLEHARTLLEQGHSATDSCYASGYQSVPTFSRAFKQRFGLAPAKYKGRHLAQAGHMQSAPMEHIPPCYAHWLGWPEIGDPG